MMVMIFKVVLLSAITPHALSFGGDNPPCELCGCSFCASGEFPVGNLEGVIPITEDFLRESFAGEGVPGDQSFADVIDQLGFTEVPCSLLDLASTSGMIPPEVCVDQLRMNSVLRDSCGCPDLPPFPAGFVLGDSIPGSSPTDSPIPSTTPSVSAAPSQSARPSSSPSISAAPSESARPSFEPSDVPSDVPSDAPSSTPV